MLANNTTSGSQYSGQCDAASLIAVVGWIVFGVGVVSNSLVLYFVVKKLGAGKRNDKLFLLNITVVNFFSLFGSLLEEILSRGRTFPLVQDYCIVFHQVNFTSLFINLTSIAALCFDRYENVTKFPAQRKLSFGKSAKIVVVGWAMALILVSCAESLFFVTAYQGNSICNDSKKTLSPIDIAGFFILIAMVTVWITVHTQVIIRSLFAIFSKLKQHLQETEQVLGVTKTVKVVKQKKQALTMVICYTVCWVPFGIVAGLTAVNVVSFHSCYYFGSLVGAYASTASTPLVYLTMDKRFRFKFGERKKEKYGPGPRIRVLP